MPSTEAEPKDSRRRVPAWLESILLVGLALVLALGIKTFLMQMFFVPSESMEPLFVTDDRMLVQKVSYWTGDVERGDVVVFEDPGGWLGPGPALNPFQKGLSLVGLYPTGGHLVKRVIGVGGDTVTCCDDEGRVTVDGTALDEESYLKDGVTPSDRPFTVEVPEGHVWVMGDNRPNSEDSRFHRGLEGGGAVPIERVVGKVWAVVWPLDRFATVKTPDTFDQSALRPAGD